MRTETHEGLHEAWKLFNGYEAVGEYRRETFQEKFRRRAYILWNWFYFLTCVAGGLLIKDIYRYWSAKPKDISNELVLVTGGGNGLGREITYELIRRGARVAICDIHMEGAEETKRVARKMAGDENVCHAYKVDVSDVKAIEELRSKIIEDFGKSVTILINNAAALVAIDLMEMSNEDVRRVVDVNLLSHFWTIRTFLRDMMANDHGHIVTIASLGSCVGIAYLVPYCATKFAVRGMTEALKEELRELNCKGVHTTCINPYFIATRKLVMDMHESRLSAISAKKAAFYTVDAMAKNYEIASTPPFFHYLLKIGSSLPTSAIRYVLKNVLGVKMNISELRNLLEEYEGERKPQ